MALSFLNSRNVSVGIRPRGKYREAADQIGSSRSRTDDEYD